MSRLALRTDVSPNEDAGPTLMVIVGVFMGLAAITTFCRIYVRARNRTFGWDDAMILVAVCFCIARVAFEIKQSQHGNGRHKVYLTAYDDMMINMYGWWGQVFLFSAIAFLKVSIGFLILRIKNTKVLKILVYTLMAGVCFTNFGVVIILLAESRPVGFWRGKSASCWPSKIRIYSIYATIAFSVTTDLLLSLLPFFIVWRVRMPLRTKISVCGLMSLGLIATGFGIARAASLGLAKNDLSWTYCIAALWSNLELFLGIIAPHLAIARSTYSYIFRIKEKSPINSRYRPTSPTTSSGSNFANKKIRGDTFEPTNTIIEAENRRPSVSRSTESQTPLEPGIQKKTEFWMSVEDMEMQRW